MKACGIKDKLNDKCAAFLLNRTSLIFINDLVNGIKNNCKLYADDTNVLSIIKDKEDSAALQRDLNRLVE